MRQIQPVKKAGAPRYPDKQSALAQPELLERLPERWKACRQAAAAAGLLAAVGTAAAGCKALFPTPEPTPLAGVAAIVRHVGETEALDLIERAAKADLAGAVRSADATKSAKPIVYVTCTDPESGYKTVTLADKTVDLYDGSLGAGIEYLSEEDGVDTMGYAGGAVAKPDADHAYVLVIPPVDVYEGSDSESVIRQQVQDFLNWLKAEGII